MAYSAMARLKKAELLVEMFGPRGMTKEQVVAELGIHKNYLKQLVWNSRQILGHDLPGAGAMKLTRKQLAAARAGAKASKMAAQARFVEVKLTNVKRCKRCHLLLQPEGDCIDCPFDLVVRAELFSRRGSVGSSFADVVKGK